MKELRQHHKELCNRFDSAVEEYNSLHRQAKWVKQNAIVPLENEIRKVEDDIRRKQKLISLE